MDRSIQTKIGMTAVLATLLCSVANLHAESFDPSSATVLSRSRISVLDSWVPYRCEFSEVSGCLESRLKARVGSTAGFVPGSDSAASATAGSYPQPSPEFPRQLSERFDQFSPAADTTTTGIPSPPSAERNSQSQTCLLVQQLLIHFETVSKVVTETHKTSGRGFDLEVFHPPRR
jgi:hypothetical protein